MYKICDNQNHNDYIKKGVNNYVNDFMINTNNNYLINLFKYIALFETEYYPLMSINITEKELLYKIDILYELIEYLQNKTFNNKKIILRQLKLIYESGKLTLKDKEFIINYIEDNPIIQYFLEYIKDKFKVLPELEMIYERYSSLLHLIIISMTITTQFNINFNYNFNDIELSNNNKITIYGNNKSYLLINRQSIWIKQLILRYCYFNYILKISKTPKILSIFLIDFPKIIYKSNKIGPVEINTGMTNGIYINITRKEEALKTLIHELIHFHNMDFRTIPDKLNKLLINNFKNITDEGYNMKFNLFEAYTECIASIINICLFYDYNKQKTYTENYILYMTFFKDQLYKQMLYTFCKCYQLYKYFNCNQLDKCKINQTTNTVSYFFIKSYFYYYIKEFIKCLNYKTLKFNNCDTSFNRIYRIINKGLQKQEKGQILHNLYKSSYNNKLNKHSMKMVCIVENIF
jgi:hypothetical protein